MDKNTIIGFILIVLLLIGFSYWNRPSKEQIEAQKQYQDSIAKIVQTQLDDQRAADYQKQLDEGKTESETDSIKQALNAAKFGDFAEASQGTEKFITLENDLLILKISTKGGRVHSAQLKNYSDYQKEPLILFKDDDARFSITLVTKNNRVIETGDLFFEAMSIKPLETTLRLKAGEIGRASCRERV